jgi:hypothetical protein
MLKTLLALTLLTVCTACAPLDNTDDVVAPETHAHVLSEGAAPDTFENPVSWTNTLPPFRVSIQGATKFEATQVQLAMDLINEAAGAELFLPQLPGEHSAVALKMDWIEDERGGWTDCVGQTCQVVVDIEYHDVLMVYVHELMHTTGYYAVDGDVHDGEGFMSARPAVDLWVDFTPRHVAYLRALVETMNADGEVE